eukprot:Gregarina_sp_Pseudo_9__2764@NODE_2_length_7458_cov_33_430786_g1_i0_p8_GENE_NODE_2_length_7458_cov_33_430786_g1_i0NODE_2_length_7458_cov_33_430786_g1_i0_p8_ORF_typecomplete_len135_score15_53zfRING_2/PF13639_6/0_042Destabilase/PF05497_12/0_024zfC3HC4_2/PF13923_6/0_38zfC3HC4/PF00097_25/0_3zfRING_5/PF14634_6/7_9zfRING_5/PF14634_6/80zfRING_5/PF14634_6/3_5e03Cys_rich_CPXG/PF14255_6/4_NODE_2_length_7458_cov_33_430786_g1_i034583862
MASCKICWEDLEDEVKVQFTIDRVVDDNTEWKDCLFCYDCIQLLLQSQFEKFMNDAINADCEKVIQRLVQRGPPVWVHDPNGFPDTGDEEIPWMRRCHNGQVFSGKLKGAKEGEERGALWAELKQFIVVKSVKH